MSYGKSYSYIDLFFKIKNILKIKFKKNSISKFNLIQSDDKLNNRSYIANSNHFKKTFNWKPSYSINKGIEKIIEIILNKKL